MCNDTPFFVPINSLYPVYDDGYLSLVQQNMEWRNTEPMTCDNTSSGPLTVRKGNKFGWNLSPIARQALGQRGD